MLRLPQQQLEAGDSAKNARDACYTVGQPHPTGTSTCIEEWPLVDCSFFALQPVSSTASSQQSRC
jgi:hypothetical protein